MGDFTATVKDTTSADEAYIDMPYGIFSFLNYDAPNLVFIAGGIGITPFISMLRYMVDKKLERNVILIWGNKTEKDIAFKSELEQMVVAMPSLRIIHVLSNQPPWPGEKGYVDTRLLHTHLDGFENPQVYRLRAACDNDQGGAVPAAGGRAEGTHSLRAICIALNR